MFNTNESDVFSLLANKKEENFFFKLPRLGSLLCKEILSLSSDKGYLASVQLTCNYHNYFLFQRSRKCVCTTVFIDVFVCLLFVDYISFSAHTDFEQTSEFIRILKPPHIVSTKGNI